VLARAAARQEDVNIRLALGATRFRLLRQQLTESVVLALLGGAAGLLVARLQPPATGLYTYRLETTQDGRVWIFAFGLTLLTGLLFGLMPAWRSASCAVVTRTRRFAARHLLVVSQVALSLVLLVIAGLFLRSVREMQTIQVGFATDHGLIVPLSLNNANYAGQETKGRLFYRALTERVQTLPGVRAVALASYVPLNNFDPTTEVQREGEEPRRVAINTIEPAYLEVLNTPLLQGRNFGPQDTRTSPGVASVDETFTRKFLPAGTDPLGGTLRLGRDQCPIRRCIPGI